MSAARPYTIDASIRWFAAAYAVLNLLQLLAVGFFLFQDDIWMSLAAILAGTLVFYTIVALAARRYLVRNDNWSSHVRQDLAHGYIVATVVVSTIVQFIVLAALNYYDPDLFDALVDPMRSNALLSALSAIVGLAFHYCVIRVLLRLMPHKKSAALSLNAEPA